MQEKNVDPKGGRGIRKSRKHIVVGDPRTEEEVCTNATKNLKKSNNRRADQLCLVLTGGLRKSSSTEIIDVQARLCVSNM